MKLTVAGKVEFEGGGIRFVPDSGANPIDLKPILETSAKDVVLAIISAGVLESVAVIASECGLKPESVGEPSVSLDAASKALHDMEAANNSYMQEINRLTAALTS